MRIAPPKGSIPIARMPVTSLILTFLQFGSGLAVLLSVKMQLGSLAE
jgi:hypothetical protein